MSKIINVIFIFIIGFLFLGSNLFEKETYKLVRNPENYDQAVVNKDSKVIKQLLTKVLEPQLNDANFINKYFLNKTLDQMSKELAIYYYQIVDFKEDPEKTIKIVNDIINNSHIYVEAGLIYLEQQKKELLKTYNEYKNLYQRTVFEEFFDTEDWKEKLNPNDLEKVNDLEFRIYEIDNILTFLKKLRVLFNLIDWSIYSKSPFAYLVRKYLNWKN